MFVVLTSKPKLYDTSVQPVRVPLETYKYMFYGHCKSIFQILQLETDCDMVITEAEPPHVQNIVSTKFLEHFPNLEAARNSLVALDQVGDSNVSLKLCK